MILYHGSYTEIKNPHISYSRNNVDFGKGFYLTPIKEQAEKWCKRFIRRNKQGIVSIYSFDEKNLDHLKVLYFKNYNEDWLDFIMNCRNGRDNSDYDIVIGGVANDKVFNTIELYLDGLIEKSEALKRLIYEKPNLQICFRNQDIIQQYLHFEGSEIYGS